MSAFEGREPGPPVEQRSKVKLIRNAKGYPQWEITVVAGDDLQTLNDLRVEALEQWRALLEALGE